MLSDGETIERMFSISTME